MSLSLEAPTQLVEEDEESSYHPIAKLQVHGVFMFISQPLLLLEISCFCIV